MNYDKKKKTLTEISDNATENILVTGLLNAGLLDTATQNLPDMTPSMPDTPSVEFGGGDFGGGAGSNY